MKCKIFCLQKFFIFIQYADSSTFKLLYFVSWGKENDAILLLQKRAVHAFASTGYRSHSEASFKFLNLLKVNDIYKLRLLVFYYNIINKVLFSNFNNSILAFSESSNVYSIENSQKQISKHSHEYI